MPLPLDGHYMRVRSRGLARKCGRIYRRVMGNPFGSCVATVPWVIAWRYDRLPDYRTARRPYVRPVVSASPTPEGPDMPRLWGHGAAPVPRTGAFSGLPLSSLPRLRYAADRDGLRENPATTGHAGTPAAWHGEGRAHGAPGARVGAVAHTAPYPAAASPSQPARDGTDGRNARPGR
jgi:hypothetical protein